MAGPPMSLEAVDVQMGWSQATYSISSLLVSAPDGVAPTSSQYSLDPSAQDKLPVRVRLSFQAGDRSGTDLTALKGYSGPLVIRLTVENVTVRAAQLSFEMNGSKYRRFGLVGAPYTVVAWADTAAGTIGQVVSAGAGRPVTNGVVSQANGDGARVLWTAMLAPPVASPTAVFTLVMDAKDFVPPQLEIVVQPGLVTDMSPEALLAGDQATNAQTVQLMSQVQQEVLRTSQLVGEVQKTLSKDAAEIGARTYSELSSSATTTLAEISALQASMKSIASQAESSVNSATSAMSQTLTDLFNHVSQDVLGDPGKPVSVSGAVIDGCDITLPSLDSGQPKTVAATLQLLAAQTGTLGDAFGDQSGASEPVTPNCRAALIAAVKASIGDLGVGCTPEEGQQDSIVCAIQAVRNTLADAQDRVSEAKGTVTGNVETGKADAQALLEQALFVQNQLSSIKGTVHGDPGDSLPSLKAAQSALSDAQEVLTDAMGRLDAIAGIAAGHTASGAALPVGLSAVIAQVKSLATQAGCQSVAGLSEPDAMAALAADPSCPAQVRSLAGSAVDLLAAAAQDSADWQAVADLADRSGFTTSSGLSYGDVAGASAEISQALAAVSDKIAQLESVYQPNNGFQMRLAKQMQDLYTGQVVLASSVAGACYAADNTPTLIEPGSADLMFDAINHWICDYQTLTTSIGNWASAISAAGVSLSAGLDQADVTTGEAVARSEQDINDVSDLVQQSISQGAGNEISDAESNLSDSLTALDQARQQAAAQLAAEMAKIVTALNEQIGSAVLSAEATKQSLAADFKALLIDLGNPDSEAPTGLIGKLRSTSEVTQSATDQLTSLAGIVQGSIDTQSLAGQALALQSQQLAIGQQMLAATPFVCGQPKPEGATTIYTIHIGADVS